MDAREILIQSLIDEEYLKTPRIIDAFRAIDRADFVLPEYQDQAYGNHPLPIGFGQTISQPLTVAFMLELLDPRPGEKILDIGSGSGWTTALLAHAVSREFSIFNFSAKGGSASGGQFSKDGLIFAMERIPELCVFAKNNIEKYGFIKNGVVKFVCQDATTEIPDGPYTKIIAAAASSKNIPDAWRENLKIGGKIVAPIDGSVWLFTKKTATEFEEKEFPGFSFVPLVKDERRRTKDKRLRTKDEKSNRKKEILIVAFVFSLLSLVLVANEIYRPHTAFSGSKSVEIPSGLGSRKITELLKKEGVIRSKWVFIIYVSLQRQASSLKPGNYVFFSSATVFSVAEDLARGGTKERTITIPEGWTVKDTADYFEREDLKSSEAFLGLVNARQSVFNNSKFDFLADKPEKAGLEGYLFPDTYRIFVNAGVEDIILKMLENFGRKLNPDLRKEIAAQKKTIFEIVTMASMVEKEVVSDQDRALVSGILWKRLGLGMGLQVDATITYILAQSPKTKDQSGRISIEDTKIDSSYNTYKYRGLPSGPISNPGLSALKAAIYPKESPYLYYLSTDEGKTIFSKTLEEHNLAKVKYLPR